MIIQARVQTAPRNTPNSVSSGGGHSSSINDRSISMGGRADQDPPVQFMFCTAKFAAAVSCEDSNLIPSGQRIRAAFCGYCWTGGRRRICIGLGIMALLSVGKDFPASSRNGTAFKREAILRVRVSCPRNLVHLYPSISRIGADYPENIGVTCSLSDRASRIEREPKEVGPLGPPPRRRGPSGVDLFETTFPS
jgi:hypothetical protein